MWTADARRRYAWTRRHAGLRLTDREWALLKPLLPEPATRGRPWKHALRVVLDAILHLLRTGCAAQCMTGSGNWRTMAGWSGATTSCSWPYASIRGGTPARRSGSSIARRSKSWHPAARDDAAKKINGRKRHILVDSLGNLLAVRVTDGAVQDRDGGSDLIRPVRALFSWLRLVVGDGAYAGHFETALAGLHLAVEIVRRPDLVKGFVLLPKRWRVNARTMLPTRVSSGRQGSTAMNSGHRAGMVLAALG